MHEFSNSSFLAMDLDGQIEDRQRQTEMETREMLSRFFSRFFRQPKKERKKERKKDDPPSCDETRRDDTLRLLLKWRHTKRMRDFSKELFFSKEKKRKKKEQKNTRKKEEEHKAFSDTERYKNGRDMGRGKDDFDADADADDSFYAVLGVERPTKKGGGTTGRNFPSEKTLERAYKRAALKYHPDRPNGDAEKFLRCTKAFETLKNPDLRKIYDTYGKKGLEPGFQPPERRPGERAAGADWFGGFQDQKKWADAQRQQRQERYARRNFGGGGGGGGFGGTGQNRTSFGIDEAMRMFKEHFGDVDLGSEFGGTNKRARRRDENGAPMPTDSREGDRIFEFECTLEELYRGCSKRLRIPPTNGLQEEIVDVHVKPGWKKGTKLTYESRGAPARDGKRGNLVLICKEVPHPVFRRADRGNDLELDVRLAVSRALCGFRATVKGLDGKAFEFDTREISIPGKTYVVKGKGMPDQRDPEIMGDCIIRITEVVFPKSVTECQRQKLKGAFQDVDMEGL